MVVEIYTQIGKLSQTGIGLTSSLKKHIAVKMRYHTIILYIFIQKQ